MFNYVVGSLHRGTAQSNRASKSETRWLVQNFLLSSRYKTPNPGAVFSHSGAAMYLIIAVAGVLNMISENVTQNSAKLFVSLLFLPPPQGSLSWLCSFL